jgi:hypothetical protein
MKLSTKLHASSMTLKRCTHTHTHTHQHTHTRNTHTHTHTHTHKARYDKENEEGGWLGGGGVCKFEGDIVSLMNRICGGKDASSWNIKKKTLSKVREDSVWGSWVQEGFDEVYMYLL